MDSIPRVFQFFQMEMFRFADCCFVFVCTAHTKIVVVCTRSRQTTHVHTYERARARTHTRARMRARGISKYNSRAICLLLLKGTKKRAAVKHSFFLNFSSRFAKNRCVFTLFHQTQCRAPLVIVPCHTSPSSGSQTGIISTTSSSSA